MLAARQGRFKGISREIGEDLYNALILESAGMSAVFVIAGCRVQRGGKKNPASHCIYNKTSVLVSVC